jgi:nucleotide-binding universal stress UspA family protein
MPAVPEIEDSGLGMARQGSIVVGTDGSERSAGALDRAGELARLLGVKLHIVSCYAKTSAGVSGVAATGFVIALDEQDEGRARAQHNVDRAQQRLAPVGVESETHVWPSEPADALVQIADEQQAQMIIVGNRGMTGTGRVLGSVPNRVSHHAHCDVLIVRTG